MYTTPSGRRKSKFIEKKLNLVPILDSVFILIFFLLLSASFLKIYEINSNVPIISSAPPPKNKKPPLALTLEIKLKKLIVLTGEAPQTVIKTFDWEEQKETFPLEEIHSFIIDLKKKHPDDFTAILEPDLEVNFDNIVKIMDAIRLVKKTDDTIWKKDKDGVDTKVETLFDDIIFGNITS
jgi:biopolymer transport protein ExbD